MEDKSVTAQHNEHDIKDMEEQTVDGNNPKERCKRVADIDTQSKIQTLTECEPKRSILESPFFEIIKRSPNNLNFTVRCCTCGILKGAGIYHIQHVRRHLEQFHPDVFEKYEKKKGKIVRKKYERRKQSSANSKGDGNSSYNPVNNITENLSVNDEVTQNKSLLKEAHKEIGDDGTPTSSKSNIMDSELLFPPEENSESPRKLSSIITFNKIETPSQHKIQHDSEDMQQIVDGNIPKKMYNRVADIDTRSETRNDNNDLPSTSTKPMAPKRLILQSPFFEPIDVIQRSKSFTVRCCTCGLLRRATLSNTSVIKLHLKRDHPDLLDIYERNKIRYLKRRIKLRDELDLAFNRNGNMPKNSNNNITEDLSINDEIRQSKSLLKEAHKDGGDDGTIISNNIIDCELLFPAKENSELRVFNENETPPQHKSQHNIKDMQQIVDGNNSIEICNRVADNDTQSKTIDDDNDLPSTSKKPKIIKENQPKTSLFENPFPGYIQQMVDNVVTEFEKELKVSSVGDTGDGGTTISSEECSELPTKLSSLGTIKTVLICTAPFYQIVKVVGELKFFSLCCNCQFGLFQIRGELVTLENHLEDYHPIVYKLYEKCKELNVYLNEEYDLSSSPAEILSLLEKDENQLNSTPLNLILAPPFFEIDPSTIGSDTLAVRCCTCGQVTIIGNFDDILGLKRHLNILHSNLFKIYGRYKQILFYSFNILMSEEKLEKPIRSINNSPLILTLPFFEAVHNNANGESILRCLYCGMLLKVYSSNSDACLTRHIQRHHPDKYNLCVKKKSNTVSSSRVEDINTNECTESLQTDHSETMGSPKESKDHTIENNSPEDMSELYLSDSTLKTVEILIDNILTNLVKQTGYFELKNKVMKLIAGNQNADHSSILALKSELENVKMECSQLRFTLSQSQAGIKYLQNELRNLDSFLHDTKLIIKNLKILDKKQPQKAVENLLKFKLNLPKVKVKNCTIITRKITSTNSDTETILVELLNAEDCNLVLSKVYKLSNTNIIIEPELSSQHRKHRNKLMVIHKELINRKPDLKVSLQRFSLVVNGKQFYWDDSEGLCHDFPSTEAIDISGVEYLNKLTGLDLSNLINILQKYEINSFHA